MKIISFSGRRSLVYLMGLFICLLASSEIKAQETGSEIEKRDKGGEPWALNIEEATKENHDYRVAKWTGEHLQMVLMSLHAGEEIDLEKHDNIDQFIRLEEGEAQVLMGKEKNDLVYEKMISDDWALFIPAGFYHKIRNTGNTDLKLYSIYAPAEHEKNTLHRTYREAQEANAAEDH